MSVETLTKGSHVLKKENCALPAIKLVGITERTSNAEEFNPETAKILPTVQHYFHNKLYEKIQNRKTPGKTYCVYTEYVTDHTDEYTFLLGKKWMR